MLLFTKCDFSAYIQSSTCYVLHCVVLVLTHRGHAVCCVAIGTAVTTLSTTAQSSMPTTRSKRPSRRRRRRHTAVAPPPRRRRPVRASPPLPGRTVTSERRREWRRARADVNRPRANPTTPSFTCPVSFCTATVLVVFQLVAFHVGGRGVVKNLCDLMYRKEG